MPLEPLDAAQPKDAIPPDPLQRVAEDTDFTFGKSVGRIEHDRLLGQVLRIFTDTVAGWYRKRHVARGLPDGEIGAVTAIQRANSDLRLSPHFHTLCLDGIYSPATVRG